MKKRYIKTSLMILSSILLFILSFWFLKMGYHNYTQDVIKYNEKGTIDYQVYLKENNFFETPFLGKGNVYITSLIDYINVDFNYNLKLDSKRSGQYKYYVKGIISANISNTDTNYWKKEFSLSDEKVVDYKNEDTIKITPKVKIDYQKYNDLLLEFKKQYSLTMDGNLKVILYVENDIDSNIDKQHLNKINTTSLEIPLTKATIEVPIKLNEVNQDNSLRTPLVYFDSIKYPILKITGVILLLIGSYLLLRTVLIIVKRFEKKSYYLKQLKKILKTYDGIIVSVKTLPNFSDFNIIDVDTFNELLDAHSEIRQPINYYESNKASIFILINGNMAWRYILKRKD